jgi:hypothetical protein
MSEEAVVGRKCTRCRRTIDLCCCEAPDCPVPICSNCLNLTLGQAMRQPHAHGG